MNIHFVGTGGAFDYDFGNAAALVEFQGQHILVDCGPSIYSELCRTGYAALVDGILITHLHGDHVGSLFTLILHLNRRLTPARKAVILCPSAAFRDHLKEFLAFSLLDPLKYVDFISLQNTPWIGSIDTTNRHECGLSSFAYYFTDGDELIYFSGDIASADVCAAFLETRCEAKITVFHDVHYERVPTHVYYHDLAQQLAGRDVYGYHVDPRRMPPESAIPLVAEHPEFLLRSRNS